MASGSGTKSGLYKEDASNTPDGIIAKLFRQILKEDKLENSIKTRISEFFRLNCSTTYDASAKTSNMLGHIGKGRMTVKVFLDILQKPLKVLKVEFIVNIHYSNGEVTSVSEEATLNDPEDLRIRAALEKIKREEEKVEDGK